jgi:hypothetical protein
MYNKDIEDLKQQIRDLEDKRRLSIKYENLIKNSDFQDLILTGLFVDNVKDLVSILGIPNVKTELYDNTVLNLKAISALQHYLNSITITDEEYNYELTSTRETLDRLINEKGNI